MGVFEDGVRKNYEVIRACRQQRDAVEIARCPRETTKRFMNKSHDASSGIDDALIAEATAQLNQEIKVLDTWLAELGQASASDEESMAAYQSYMDMRASRCEMLSSLLNQTKSTRNAE